jgi:hypothetical protein
LVARSEPAFKSKHEKERDANEEGLFIDIDAVCGSICSVGYGGALARDGGCNHRPWREQPGGSNPKRRGALDYAQRQRPGQSEHRRRVLRSRGIGIQRGQLTAVVGTLVCNPGNAAGNPENAVDTPAANLSTEGNAELSFKIIVPTVCNNPVFLIRVPAGKWIATGTKPSSSSKSHY